MDIIKGDIVKILKGKDRTKTGKVVRVFPDLGKILVEGLNLYKKHARPKKQGEKGEVVQIAKPLAVANVGLFCQNCKLATRVGHKFEREKKLRYCKKCGSNI